MATGYFSHPDCLAHDMGAGHPECAQRIHAIEDQLRAHGLDALLTHGEVPLASNDDLALAHDLNYVLTLDDFLQQLEASRINAGPQADLFAPAAPPPEPPTHAAVDALAALDPDSLSPREALDALYALKKLVQED